jgi:hypothetical protein
MSIPLPEQASLARSVKKSTPMFFVRDMRDTIRWYESIGFTLIFSQPEWLSPPAGSATGT